MASIHHRKTTNTSNNEGFKLNISRTMSYGSEKKKMIPLRHTESITNSKTSHRESITIISKRRLSVLVCVLLVMSVSLILMLYKIEVRRNRRKKVILSAPAVPDFEVAKVLKRQDQHNRSLTKNAVFSSAYQNALEWKELSSSHHFEHSQTNRLSGVKLSTPPTFQGEDYHSHFQGYTLKFVDKANFDDNNHHLKNETKDEQTKKSAEKFCGLAKDAALLYPDLYPQIHALNQDSVVLITGILNKLGFNLALYLATKCHVRVIAGIDPAFPHFSAFREGLLKKINILSTVIPGFVQPLIVPYYGLNPPFDFLKKFQPFFSDTTGQLDYSKVFPKPITHIVHLVPSDPYTYRDLESNYKERINDQSILVNPETGKTSPAFSLTQNMIGMEHMLTTLESDSKVPIHFTFVSDTDIIPISHSSYFHDYKINIGVDDTDEEKEEKKHRSFHTVTNLINELIFQYHGQMFNHSSVGVRLPHVYGPWDKNGSIFHDLMQEATKRWSEPIDEENLNDLHKLLGNKGLGSDPFDILHIDDALNAIVAAMQFRDNKCPTTTFNILSGEKINVSEFAELVEAHIPNSLNITKRKLLSYETTDFSTLPLESKKANDYLQWKPKTNVMKGIRQTLAFHLNADEDRNETLGNNFLRSHNESPCNYDDNFCLRGLHPKLCSSECSKPDFCRSDRQLEEAINKSINITNECEIVVYTAPLEPETLSIRAKFEESTNEEDTIACGIAFVSSDSKLIEMSLNNNSFNETMNGVISSDGWKLVVVDVNVAHIATYRDLLKLSPGKAFASSVKKVMYVDHNLPITITTNDAVFTASLLTRWANEFPLSNTFKSPTGQDVRYHILEGSRSAVLVAPALRLDQDEGVNHVINNVQQAVTFMSPRINHPISGNSNRQMNVYQQSHPFLNTDEFGEDQGLNFIKHKIHHWISSEWLMHDLERPEGKSLRCEWYSEHSLWNADLDETSFAYIMGLRDFRFRRTIYDTEMPVDSSIIDKTEEKNQWYLAPNKEELGHFSKFQSVTPSDMQMITTVRIIDEQSLKFERALRKVAEVDTGDLDYALVMHQGELKKRYKVKRKIIRPSKR